MKFLIISSYLPYPLHSGGQVRLFNLIKELSTKHEITLICEKRLHQTASDIKEVEKICRKVVTVERRKQWSIPNLLRTTFSTHSFLASGHNHTVMQKEIKEELERTTFDLIHVETFYVAQNIPVTPLPIVLIEHNIEYLVYKRFVERAPLPLRPFLYLDIAKIKREEEQLWKKVKKIVAVSYEDKKIMESYGVKPVIVANGVDINKFVAKNTGKALAEKEKKILFIGDFKWIQNRDTATWIIKEIWPKIKKESGIKNQESSIRLWIVGREIPDSIKQLTNDPDVIFDEESSKKPTPTIFQEASILLAPIRVGGGTSYKILESMASGTPVVTMQLSADSLQAKDGEELMVGKSAEELASKTMVLLQDESLYEKISRNARILIEKKYSWKEIAKTLDEVYKEVVT